MHLSIWQEIGWSKNTETRISCQWSFHRCRGLCYNIGYQLGIHIGELQTEDFLDANMSIMAQSCLLSFTLVYLFCLILRRVVTSPRLLFLFSGTCLTPRASLTPQLENVSTCCIPVSCLRCLKFKQVLDRGSFDHSWKHHKLLTRWGRESPEEPRVPAQNLVP